MWRIKLNGFRVSNLCRYDDCANRSRSVYANPGEIKLKQKKFLAATTPEMLIEIDALAAKEHRNRADLIREALRRYLDAAKVKEAEMRARSNQIIQMHNRHQGIE